MEAKDQISEIHRLLDHNTRFRDISGWAVITTGILAIVFYIPLSLWLEIQWWKPLNEDLLSDALIVDSVREILLMFILLLFCVAMAAGLILRFKIPSEKKAFAKKQLLNFSAIYAIYILTGFSIAFFLIRNTPDTNALLLCIPLMLLLYGVSQIHVARIAIPELVYFGYFVFVLGLAGIFLPLWSWIFWFIAMGAGHIVLGILMLKKYRF